MSSLRYTLSIDKPNFAINRRKVIESVLKKVNKVTHCNRIWNIPTWQTTTHWISWSRILTILLIRVIVFPPSYQSLHLSSQVVVKTFQENRKQTWSPEFMNSKIHKSLLLTMSFLSWINQQSEMDPSFVIDIPSTFTNSICEECLNYSLAI